MKKTIYLLFLLSISASVRAQPTVLNHIAVYVHDLATCREFYQKVIGLDTVPEPFHDGRHTWFSIGGRSCLHLIAGATSASDHDKNSHLCFSVPSVPDFIERLRLAGIAYEDWPGKTGAVTTRSDGVHQIYFRDPEGWWIEVNDAK